MSRRAAEQLAQEAPRWRQAQSEALTGFPAIALQSDDHRVGTPDFRVSRASREPALAPQEKVVAGPWIAV
jgi:hypothetical protein